jgi:WD40 repeat protein
MNQSSGKALQNLRGHINSVYSASWALDGKYIFTTAGDHKTILWDAATGKQLYTRLQLDNNDWLVYDEDYHFDGSEKAINYLYLTCGLKVVNINKVKKSLRIPGLAGKIMNKEPLLINNKPAPRLIDLDICD